MVDASGGQIHYEVFYNQRLGFPPPPPPPPPTTTTSKSLHHIAIFSTHLSASSLNKVANDALNIAPSI